MVNVTDSDQSLTHKTRANHFKRRMAMGGHLWLQEGGEPALVFRSHGFFQRRYELRLPISEIQSTAGWTLKMEDGRTERFVVASGTRLEGALAEARSRPKRMSTPTADVPRAVTPSAASSVAPSPTRVDSTKASHQGPPTESAARKSGRVLDRASITRTPQLPGFKHLDVIGFSSALHKFAQAIPMSEWGYGLTVDGAVILWEARTGIVSDSQYNVYEPIRLPARRLAFPTQVMQLAGAKDYMLALDENGDVWAWGEDHPEAIGHEGGDFQQPLKVTSIAGVACLTSTGSTHLALTTAGEIWSWGSAYGGRLGDNSESDRTEPALLRDLVDVTAIRTSPRKDRLVALDKAGSVWTWGYDWNFDGEKSQRSVPARLSALPPIRSLGDGETAIDHDGRVWRWDESRDVSLVPGLTEVVDVVHGENNLDWKSSYHALDEHGRVFAWGYNNMGQLGDGTTVDREEPVSVGGMGQVSSLISNGRVVYALNTSGDIFGWGGYANERVDNIESLYGPSPRQLRLPDFTEPRMARWATLDLVSLGSQELRQTFFDFREGRTPLMQCSAAGVDDEVAVMLTQSGDVNAVDADGDTALFYAAGKGQIRIVDLLLKAGANPNIHRIAGGNSPLAQAATMSLSFSGAAYPPGKTPDDYWAVTLRLIRGGAHPSDMYSRHIAAARHTDRGLQVIREEHITNYMWHDDLFPMQVNPHSGLL